MATAISGRYESRIARRSDAFYFSGFIGTIIGNQNRTVGPEGVKLKTIQLYEIVELVARDTDGDVHAAKRRRRGGWRRGIRNLTFGLRNPNLPPLEALRRERPDARAVRPPRGKAAIAWSNRLIIDRARLAKAGDTLP